MTYDDYGSAREFFQAARDASVDASRTREMLERMERAEGLRGQAYGPRVSSGAADAMGRTDARIDFEGAARERIREDDELVAQASTAIMGREPGRGGVAALLGAAYADAMWHRFVLAEPWSLVAERVGMSERWCRDACDVAMDLVDARGFADVADGLGGAT